MNADEMMSVIDALNIARRILVTHHDIVDVGVADGHPSQGPNWAMRATQLLDETMEQVRSEGDE